jgi:hypothetical protein
MLENWRPRPVRYVYVSMSVCQGVQSASKDRHVQGLVNARIQDPFAFQIGWPLGRLGGPETRRPPRFHIHKRASLRRILTAATLQQFGDSETC